MKGESRERILNFITEHGQASPHDLAEYLEISPQALHRHLKHLLTEKNLIRVGSPPHVFYLTEKSSQKSILPHNISEANLNFLRNHYTYISPQGRILTGIEAFETWAIQTQQQKHLLPLIEEYIKVRTENLKQLNSTGLIDASIKFQSTFKTKSLSRVYYSDFYSLPKFGKTRLGTLVLHAKQAQDSKLIKKIAEICKNSLRDLIHKEKIQAIVWVPHSLPRKIPFLKEFRRDLKLGLPEIEFMKAYAGEVPVAQKSLSKLEERMENARSTIFPKSSEFLFKKILIIDDAVGSGSTLEAIATKIKKIAPSSLVLGYAIVGSLKGFEVIKEV